MLPFRAGKFFRDFPDFLHRPNGVRELRQRVRPDGAAPFLHRKAGVRELPQAGSPLTGGSFSAPESRGARTALACSPFLGGEFFAEPQQGDSPSADGGNVPRPAAGTTPYPRRWAKRKDNLRFSFLFELLPFPCFLIWRRLPICDRCENRERQSGYRSVCFATYSQFTDRLLLHIRATLRRHGICEYNLLHNISCRVRRPRRTVCKFICRRITVGANNVRPHHR